jgi:hypothetical protein
MKMQKALFGVVGAITLLGAAPAQAASVSAVAPASVIVLAPVTVTPIQGLDFGAVIRPANDSSNLISLDTSSAVTVSGSGDGSRSAGAVSAAKFNIVGDPGITYSTTQSLAFNEPGLTNVTATAPATTNGAPGVIPESGVQEIRFGGSFMLTAATPAKAYSGALTVTVNYN